MNIIDISKVRELQKKKVKQKSKDAIIEYYTETTQDYQDWSQNFNMHFGYYDATKSWKQIFDLESMLENMNKEVIKRLQLKKGGNKILDMGAGLGATARHAIKKGRNIDVTGISLVPWQVEKAQELAQENISGKRRIRFEVADFEKVAKVDDSFDGIYALESICHGEGKAKHKVIGEMYRLLKPNGKVVIVDGFINKKNSRNPFFKWAYKNMCDGWAVEGFAELEAVINELKIRGFKSIKVEECFNQVAPSALHVPWVNIKYFFKRIVFSKRFYIDKILRKQRLKHLKACFLSMFIGLARKQFNYCIVSAEK